MNRKEASEVKIRLRKQIGEKQREIDELRQQLAMLRYSDPAVEKVAMQLWVLFEEQDPDVDEDEYVRNLQNPEERDRIWESLLVESDRNQFREMATKILGIARGEILRGKTDD